MIFGVIECDFCHRTQRCEVEYGEVVTPTDWEWHPRLDRKEWGNMCPECDAKQE